MTTDPEHTHRCAPGCQNETCYMCGHTHRVMAHWSSNGETRALCHADDHSCYTDHNRMDALRREQINRDRAEGQDWGTPPIRGGSVQTYEPRPGSPAEGTVWLDVLPNIDRFLRQLKGLRVEVTRTQKAVQRLSVVVNRRKPLIHKGGKP